MIYTPKYFTPKSNNQIREFIKNNSFATLISVLKTGELQISKTPFKLIEASDRWTLEGHLAFNNPHLETLQNHGTVTILFDGAHGYISPTHYKNPQKSVPTWNYSTAILQGQAEVIDDPEWLVNFVSELSSEYENDNKWISQVDKDYINNLGKRATGFRIEVTSIEAKFKLNQQTPEKERNSLIQKVSIANPSLANDMRNTDKWSD